MIVTLNPSAGFIAGVEKMPGDVVVYASAPMDVPGARVVPIDRVQPVQRVRTKLSKYVAPSWDFDVLPAAEALLCFAHAARECSGLCVWLAGEVVEAFTEADLRRELGKQAYAGMFVRKGMPSQPDFMMLDGAHEQHQEVLLTLETCLLDGTFEVLGHWTIGGIMDAVLKQCGVPVKDLSGAFGKEKSPLSMSALARFIRC